MIDKRNLWVCTNREYHSSFSEDSHSSLDLFHKSIEQYAAIRVFKLIKPPAPTDAMKFGTLFHTLVLEPENFDKEYVINEKHDGRTKIGKVCKIDFLERAAGREVVEQSDVDMVLAMKDGIERNQPARWLLSQYGEPEVSFRCKDKDTGCNLKVRMDYLSSCGDGFTIVDLKTTDDVSPKAWSRTAHNFGYHRQAAMYLDCCKEHGIPADRFVFLACSKTPPHECVAYQPDIHSIQLGRTENSHIMAELSRRRSLNDWSGRWSGEVNTFELPAYAFRSSF